MKGREALREMLMGGGMEAGKDRVSTMGLVNGENMMDKGEPETALLRSNRSESF